MNTDYKSLQKLSQDIFSTTEILLEHCKHKDEEDIIKLLPIIEMLYKTADDLNFKIMQIENIS